jgi:hypothetical protein
MAVRDLHPILYVRDPYAERHFFMLYGFKTIYEGDESPGFLAVAAGGATSAFRGTEISRPKTSTRGFDGS